MVASANMRFAVLVNLATIILRVTTSSSKSNFTCNAGTYFPGDEGYVICHFGRDIHNSTYHFEIVMHRIGSLNSENGRDVLRCHWLEEKLSCRTAQGFEFDDDILDNITVRISKVTAAFEGLYACQLIPPGLSTVVPCTLQVTDPTPALPASDVNRTFAIVFGVSTLILLILTGCMLIFIVRIWRKLRRSRCPSQPYQVEVEHAAPSLLWPKERVPLFEMPELEDVRGKLWYFHHEDEHDLLSFKRNRVDGSFGIERCTRNPRFHVLKVYYGYKLNIFRLSSSEEGFAFLDSGTCFRNLSQLVAYHRQHDIIDKYTNTSYGKLVKPFEKAPDGPWYAGKMERRAQDKLLLSQANGAFLIRESVANMNAYTLAVNIKGTVHVYRIIVEDDGYKLGEADEQKYFPTLSALVKYYTGNDLVVHGQLLGRLSKPAQGIAGAAAADTKMIWE